MDKPADHSYSFNPNDLVGRVFCYSANEISANKYYVLILEFVGFYDNTVYNFKCFNITTNEKENEWSFAASSLELLTTNKTFKTQFWTYELIES